MALDYFDAEIIEIIQETPTVRRFILEFKDMERFDFKAGQYVKVDMPLDDKKTYRQYSIASAPMGDNKIELLIVFNPVGKGTGYLFNVARVGTILKISKALGRFVLPEEIDKEICFICTGVGLAPFRSMYLDVVNNNIPNKGLKLIFGTRNTTDLLYQNELEKLHKEIEYFDYLPTLSRSGEDWKGRKGYVHPIYTELYSEAPPVQFYLCGWDAMISEAKKNLKGFGYVRKDILFEKYD